ncbi:hypothetical protein [Azospirillum sp. TSH100]|uniref:hypothetical protein n=1 Tax=Azospirillum sp. TSH100 TaxID=652764 RepID=UPI0010AB30B0|nr:hypothetical protein [Azospirillum sp. TSH100]QCG90715.1 hypothetical protein E6C72_23305 [Azospirillum sp. TSH100]
MPKFPTLLAVVAPMLLCTAVATPVLADTLACQTVNGRTVCMRGSGTLNCVTHNGRTRCTTTPSGPESEVVPDVEFQQLSRPASPDPHGPVVDHRGFPFGHQAHSLPLDDDPDID